MTDPSWFEGRLLKTPPILENPRMHTLARLCDIFSISSIGNFRDCWRRKRERESHTAAQEKQTHNKVIPPLLGSAPSSNHLSLLIKTMWSPLEWRCWAGVCFQRKLLGVFFCMKKKITVFYKSQRDTNSLLPSNCFILNMILKNLFPSLSLRH